MLQFLCEVVREAKQKFSDRVVLEEGPVRAQGRYLDTDVQKVCAHSQQQTVSSACLNRSKIFQILMHGRSYLYDATFSSGNAVTTSFPLKVVVPGKTHSKSFAFWLCLIPAPCAKNHEL